MAQADAKKEKAKEIALIKTALRKALQKNKDGQGVRVAFAFARGKDKNDHIFKIDPRKKAQALIADIQKAHKERKQLGSGTCTVTKEGGKFLIQIKYIKKMPGAERLMQESLKAMSLPQYKVVLEKVKDDEEVADISDSDSDLEAEDAEDAEDEHEDTHAAAGADEDEEEESDDDERGQADEDEDEGETEEASDEADEDEEEGDEDEDEEEDEEEKAPAAAKGALSPEKMDTLKKLPLLYRGTHAAVSKQFEGLKSAIRQTYSSEAPELIAEIDKGLGQIDAAIAGFDHSIAEELEKAHQAKDEATRRAHLEKCQALHTKNIHFLASNPMLKHIENNPFGVQVPVVKTYAVSFQQIDKHIKDMLKK